MIEPLRTGRSRRDGAVRRLPVVLCAVALATSPAAARAGVIDEIWAGGLAHDLNDFDHGKESDSGDVQIEVDTARPAALRPLGAPRVNLVLAVNSAGHSDLASAGLTWDHRIFRQLYGSVDFGLGVTDGLLSPPPGPTGAEDERNRLLLGSRVLFREAAGLDWRLDPRWSIGVEFVHASNGHILSHGFNQGITDAGVRLGYRFR
jgi:hypothetical protein